MYMYAALIVLSRVLLKDCLIGKIQHVGCLRGVLKGMNVIKNVEVITVLNYMIFITIQKFLTPLCSRQES